MKPIIVDMREMSDSTEVYEARPNPVLTGFIYLILAMLVAAFVWMGLFEIDVVVDAMGTVAAAKEVATITNQVPGIITERLIEDGQEVQKGDVLYTISHEEKSMQLELLQRQLADNESREAILKAYEAWLQGEEVFLLSEAQNPYYTEIAARKLLVELQGENSQQAYAKEMQAYEIKLDANDNLGEYYSSAVEKLRQLVEAIKSRSNPFDSDESYYYNFVENYVVQYQNLAVQYDSKIKPLQKERSTVEKLLGELEAEKQALLKLSEPEGTPSITVSSGDNEGTQQRLQAIEEQIETQSTAKSAIDSSISDYFLQKNSALLSMEKENIASVESSILAYEQNLASCVGAELEYESGRSALLAQGTELAMDNLLVQEQYSVAEELEACRQTRTQLEQQINSLQKDIEAATVCATMDGTINLASTLVEGDYLGGGTPVLTIIPQTKEGTFIVKSYVENTDIAKVHEGMEVTYEIGAFPSREYGTLKGEVTFVSPDLRVNDSGSAYYVVEFSVNAGELCNRMGEQANLKIGMLCETKVVIESKTVLEVLLEKVLHL